MSFTKEQIGKVNFPLLKWVEETAQLTTPSDIFWCDGSKNDRENIISKMLSKNELIKLNENEYSDCYLYRNNPDDTARDEERTFICSTKPDDVGPTNKWMAIKNAKDLLSGLFSKCMKGRTMYVVPYLAGPRGSRYSEAGVEITDSPLIVLTLDTLTRMGAVAIENILSTKTFIKGLHSTGDLNKDKRYICHFPEENLIISINTNYAGDAALSKKPHALRLASVIGRKNGWLAEHIFVIEIKSPRGNTYYVSGAFPSSSGKTNLALMKPPDSFQNWQIKTIGDDIGWLHIDKNGEMRAINPENGFFGTAYDCGKNTLPNILSSLKKDVIFTNVGLTPDFKPWWEGLTDSPPEEVIDWTGNKWVKNSGEPVANENARFSVSLSQYPFKSDKYEDQEGVPISTILFGGRRADLIPLVYEAYNWEHGILMGAMMRAETTTAQLGKVGVLRQDPMAMMSFCGYNMADYFAHWIDFGKKLKKKPKIFSVNWFRKDERGNFIWPGFSENFRIIKWMIERHEGSQEAIQTPIGYIPKLESLDLNGMNIKGDQVERLLYIDNPGWHAELEMTRIFFEKFGDRLPKELWDEYYRLETRLKE
jgi:phosphoenolpyruvate carboxykinase (GTP)